MYLGVHFLSDVLGGYVVGLLWLVIGVSLAELLRARSPLAPPFSRPMTRVALTTVLVVVATAFYVVTALRYAPPLANIEAPAAASSPALAE